MIDLATTERSPIERLVAHLTHGKGVWPLECEKPVLTKLNTWQAIAENNKDVIKRIAGVKANDGKTYRIDPLGERIAETWAAYLWGEDPRIIAGGPGTADGGPPVDQPLMDQLLGLDPTGGGGVMLASELERAAAQCVAEGEVWSRIYVDPSIAQRPLLEWHSRCNIVPLWVGSRLVAAAVVTELEGLPGDEQRKDVWRMFECHQPGRVINVLFKGGPEKIGRRVELEAHPRTANLPEEWLHGCPTMLLERIPNRLRGRGKVGVSDFEGILDFLIDLNEVASIGATNVRLTARKRAVISAAAAEANNRGNTDGTLTPEEPGTNVPRVRYDAAEEVYVADPLDGALGESAPDPFRILEYSFDAQALIAWQTNLVQTTLSRVALTGQTVGTGDQNAGYAISGTAIRLRLIPTDKTGRAKARYWEDSLPRIIGNMVRIDAGPPVAGGFGRDWKAPEETPKIERQPGLPIDGLEEAQRHQALVTAGVESITNAVRELHPGWTPKQVQDEVDAIREDRAKATPGAVGSLLGV